MLSTIVNNDGKYERMAYSFSLAACTHPQAPSFRRLAERGGKEGGEYVNYFLYPYTARSPSISSILRS